MLGRCGHAVAVRFNRPDSCGRVASMACWPAGVDRWRGWWGNGAIESKKRGFQKLI